MRRANNRRTTAPVTLPQRATTTPTDQTNPYSHLNLAVLSDILAERDVDIGTGSFLDKASRLNDLDVILPEWRDNILRLPIIDLPTLSNCQIYFYASAHGVDIGPLYTDNLTKSILGHTIAALVLCRNQITPNPPAPQPIVTQTTLAKTLVEVIEFARQGIIPQVESAPTVIFGIEQTELDRVLRAFVEYPLTISADQYNVLRRLRPRALTRAAEYRGVGRVVSQFLTKEDILFALSRMYLPPLSPQCQQAINRYDTIRRLTNDQREMLIEIYGFDNRYDDPYIEVAKVTACSPLEPFVLSLGQRPIDEIADGVGMIIPPGADKRTYFRENLTHYKKIFTRRPGLPPPTPEQFTQLRTGHVAYLDSFTDMELFTSLGVYISYSSRHELINQLIALRTGNSFFIPLSRQRCTNKQTLLYNDTNDPTLFLIGYGNLMLYLGYEMDELLGSFHYRGEGIHRDFVFLRPENLRSFFHRDELENLRHLIRNYPQTAPLLQRITEGLIEMRRKTDYDRNLIRQWENVPQASKEKIHQYLHRLFITGMYMRRWDGPGTQYPMQQRQTNRARLPDVDVSRELIECENLLSNMTGDLKITAKGFHIVEYYGTEVNQTNQTIGHLYDEVRADRYCIRQASSKFVGTGAYYLNLLFTERIPNFDPSQLDTIS